MILLIDNYDSFSYNLYQYIGSINEDIKVIRNDDLTEDEIIALNPSHIVISPGPGCPRDAGVIEKLIKKNKHIPLLGICLGHQAICEAFGGEITNAQVIVHGKSDLINIDNTNELFKGLDKTMKAARYHSLIGSNLPDELSIIAYTNDNLIMGVKHKEYPIYGIQFHPESILTEHGKEIIKNFLEVK